MNHLRQHKGYILPTVLVFSLVTMALGVTFLQYATSFSSILRNDYYANLAKQAADAGVHISQKCFQQERLTVDDWPDGATLQPNTDCEFTVDDSASEFVSETPVGDSTAILRTTYAAEKPTEDGQILTFSATGTTELFPSASSTHAAFTETAHSKIQVPATHGYVEIDAATGNVITDISTGLGTTCAIANMSPYCWGMNISRQTGTFPVLDGRLYLDRPTKIDEPSNTANETSLVDKRVHTLTSGPNHSCAISGEGQLHCWGQNAPFGTLGIAAHVLPPERAPSHVTAGSLQNNNIPTSMSGANPTSLIGSGLGNFDAQQTSCVIINGQVSCAGQNFFAQLGQVRYGWEITMNSEDVHPSFCIKQPWPLSGCIVPSLRQTVYPTAEFTMWAFGSGVLEYIAGNDSNEFVPVFGYDKSQPQAHQSKVGKFNASEIALGQTNACSNENGKIFCWGEHAMPWVYSQNEWLKLCPGVGLVPTPETIMCPGIYMWLGNTVADTAPRNGSLDNKMAYGLTASHMSLMAIAEGRAHYWKDTPWNRGFLGFASWGINFIPLPMSQPVMVSAAQTDNRDVTQISRSGSDSYGCFLTSGIPYCWGNMAAVDNEHTPKRIDTFPGPVDKIDAGRAYTCGLVNGAIYCFGEGGSRQIGDGARQDRSIPTKAADIGTETGYATTDITSGENHSCGIIDGSVFCWGENDHGQIGIGSYVTRSQPTRVNIDNIEPEQRSTTAVSAGRNHTCAVIEGDAYCWGANNYGQLGRGGGGSNIPVKVNFGFSPAAVTDVTAGADHTCATVNGHAYCWGRNSAGQLGMTGGDRTTPTKVNVGTPARHITQIEAGENFTCAIGAERAWCWGSNDSGQIGRNNMGGENQTHPFEVELPGKGAHNGVGNAVTEIATGDRFACAVMNGRTYCWGANGNGQLGRNSTQNAGNPALVSGSSLGNRATNSLSAGSHHACGIINGRAQCWGSNSHGQIGNPSVPVGGNATTAVPVREDANVLGTNYPHIISAGGSHSCTIANGNIACWGSSTQGQLGGNDLASSPNMPKWTHNKYAVPGFQIDWSRAVRF